MKARRKCAYVVPLPQFTDEIVVFGIMGAAALILLIYYFWSERKRAKTFYGQKDHLSVVEEATDNKKKEEIENLVFGGQNKEVLVINSPTTSPNGGVKIMMRKRNIRKQTPINFNCNAYTPAETSIIGGGPTPAEINFTVIFDRLGRALELLRCLKSCHPSGTHSKMAEIICSEIRERLQAVIEITLVNNENRKIEYILASGSRQYKWKFGDDFPAMTGRLYTIYGLVNEEVCIVKGHENLFVDVGQIALQMKLSVQKPFQMTIVAHEISIATVEATLEKEDVTMVTTKTMQVNEQAVNTLENTTAYFSTPHHSILKKSDSNKNMKTPHQTTKKSGPLLAATPLVTPRAQTNKTSSKKRPKKTEHISSSQLSTPHGSIQQQKTNRKSVLAAKNDDISVISLNPAVVQPVLQKSAPGSRPAASRSSAGPKHASAMTPMHSKHAPTPTKSHLKSDALVRNSRKSKSTVRAKKTDKTPTVVTDPPVVHPVPARPHPEKPKGLKSELSHRPRPPTESRPASKRQNASDTPR